MKNIMKNIIRILTILHFMLSSVESSTDKCAYETAKHFQKVKRDAKTQKMKSKPDPNSPAILYLPLGGSGKPQCLPSAGAKLAQLVPMMFAGMTFTIFDAVATVANNINSNNNNLNDQNINFQMSSNTVVTGNVNVANQINVMNMAGRKKRAAEIARKALDWMAKYNTLAVVTPELIVRGQELY